MRSTHSLNSNSGSPARCWCALFFSFFRDGALRRDDRLCGGRVCTRMGVEKAEEGERGSERTKNMACVHVERVGLPFCLPCASVSSISSSSSTSSSFRFVYFVSPSHAARSRIVDRVEYRSLQMRFTAAANKSTPGLSGSLSTCSISREKLPK